ncbi:MAG: lasso peptide biosynthesis B2 protein [Pseudonocardiales bacterium]
MSAPIALAAPCILSFGERCAGSLAVAAAGLLLVLTRARPYRLRSFLHLLSRGSTEVDLWQAERAWEIVTTVSLRCASGHGCLLRSVAIVILCRLSGTHVTWRAGFRSPPPQSHAWIEASGEPVRETVDPRTIYTPVITV